MFSMMLLLVVYVCPNRQTLNKICFPFSIHEYSDLEYTFLKLYNLDMEMRGEISIILDIMIESIKRLRTECSL